VRVNFVTYGVVETKGDQLYSPLASARYRVIQPMHGLARRGHMVSLVQIGEDDGPDHVMTALDADIVILSKAMSPQPDLFEKISATVRLLIDRLHAQRRQVVADISDNHFEHHAYGSFYRHLVRQVDAVVVSTLEMSALVGRFTDRPVSVVADPFEGPRGEPHFRAPDRRLKNRFARWLSRRERNGELLRLVWFGHQSNWKTMCAIVDSLLIFPDIRIELEVITAPVSGAARFCKEFNAMHGSNLKLLFTPWSLSATWQGLARAALVLIPSWPDDERKAVKSSNRLVDSLRAGRFVIANPLPAYQPLEPYCWLGDSIIAGLKWALDHPDEVRRRLLEGQVYIESIYSPEVIAGEWEAVLAKLPTGCN
jgi:hypothetical protein